MEKVLEVQEENVSNDINPAKRCRDDVHLHLIKNIQALAVWFHD